MTSKGSIDTLKGSMYNHLMNKDIGSLSVKGNQARTKKLTPERRSEIAKVAAKARWSTATLITPLAPKDVISFVYDSKDKNKDLMNWLKND